MTTYRIEKTIYGEFWRFHENVTADSDSTVGVHLFQTALEHPNVTFRALQGTKEIARVTPLPGGGLSLTNTTRIEEAQS